MMPEAQRWSGRHPGVLDQPNNCDPCSSKLAARQQAHRSLRVNCTKVKVAAPLRCYVRHRRKSMRCGFGRNSLVPNDSRYVNRVYAFHATNFLGRHVQMADSAASKVQIPLPVAFATNDGNWRCEPVGTVGFELCRKPFDLRRGSNDLSPSVVAPGASACAV